MESLITEQNYYHVGLLIPPFYLWTSRFLSFHFVPDDLCEGKFQCDNGQCIDRNLVCDVYHSRDCVDGSDEAICGLVTDYTGQGEVLYVAVHC